MGDISGTKTSDNECVSNNNNEDSLQASKVSKKHNQACKLQNLGTRIPAKTLERFRLHVIAKHGMLHKYFSKEITIALESHMNKQQQTTSFAFSSSTSVRPRADKIDKLRQISMKLKQLTSFPNVNPFTIVNTIKNVLGQCDRRTLNSYLIIIKKLSKETISTSGTGSVIDVTKFVEKIQSDDW